MEFRISYPFIWSSKVDAFAANRTALEAKDAALQKQNEELQAEDERLKGELEAKINERVEVRLR
jgi:hypothetical protein